MKLSLLSEPEKIALGVAVAGGVAAVAYFILNKPAATGLTPEQKLEQALQNTNQEAPPTTNT
jgi:predicted DsbA family dithiol-disulfide isomerase